MTTEDNTFVIKGPKQNERIPDVTYSRIIYDSLLSNTSKHDALVDVITGETISYPQLLQETCNLATALRNAGYRANTVMSISSENNIKFFIPVIAAIFNGAPLAPLNHSYTPTELRHTLHITSPKVIFCSEKICEKFVQLKKELRFIEKIIVIDANREIDGAENLKDFVERSLKGITVLPYAFQPFDGDPARTVALVMCSSGTTGLPKGVMQSHRNLVARLQDSRDPLYGMSNEGPTLGILPFFHGFGMTTSLEAIINKRLIVIIRQFEEDLFLKTIQDYKISSLTLAPPLVVFFAKTPKLKNYNLSHVKEVLCGAAPLSKHTELEVKQRLNLNEIRQGYGLTETTLAVIILKPNINKPGSCGQVVNFMTCKVRDPETGKSLGPHKVGELCFKGPMVMMGYYGNPQSTKESFTSDGWLRTGDLGYYDEDEYFYIVDRLKELIKYKGFQVAPAELEAILLNHPKIRDCGVIGLPEELSGELPLAFVVKKDEVDLTVKEVQEYVAVRVSPQKRLRGGVIFVSAIPKNPSGKILRRELRQMLKTQRANVESKL